jgi:RNA polymerase sigma-70 factor (ECF subfamily)
VVGRVDDPEQQAVLADSAGRALLVVLETLAPAERLASVLYDLFAMPFDEIAPIVVRTPHRVQGAHRLRGGVRRQPGDPAVWFSTCRTVIESLPCRANSGHSSATRVSQPSAPASTRRCTSVAVAPLPMDQS